jgi:ADP-ribose pyrophosphatase YjhB (NUDIX family)
MAELVDAADSKSVALKRRVGSIPSPGTINRLMNFCSNCGSRVVLKVPEGDLLPRHVCENCSTIHYENPKIVVGSVPEYEGRILICKRGIEPRLGYWTIPAGFMENDETLEAGAAREALEEARIAVEIGSLLLLANVTHARQVHVFFRSRMLSPDFGVTHESLEVALVDEKDIPWSDLAFPSTEYALRRFVEDRKAGIDRHHVAQMQRRFR